MMMVTAMVILPDAATADDDDDDADYHDDDYCFCFVTRLNPSNYLITKLFELSYDCTQWWLHCAHSLGL